MNTNDDGRGIYLHLVVDNTKPKCSNCSDKGTVVLYGTSTIINCPICQPQYLKSKLENKT